MRLTVVVIVTLLLQVSLSGQSQTVSLSGNNIPLKQVFDAIKRQTGYLFFYNVSHLENAKPVTVDIRNARLETALDQIFKDQPLTWELEGKTITIVKRPLQSSETLAPVPKPHETNLVKGIVTDFNNHPIADVTVLVIGTVRGTATDKNGVFSIEAVSSDILRVSSVSHISKDVKVDQNQLNIKLQLEIKPFEVLLVGGNLNAIKRKADATSVTILDSKTLERIPENTLDQIFRGWVPGTNSFDVGDEPEGFPTLSIRGAGGAVSLTTIAVYIDGIEYAGGSGYLSQLDKNNIDRIEIVRGPGAATMYGTGSNAGIVQIFTKKGKSGRSTVNVLSSVGFIKSKWVNKDPFQQMHNVETITGFKKAALTLGGSYRTAGGYMPDGGEKNKGFYGGVNFKTGKLQVNLNARYNTRNYNLTRSPLYDTAINPRTDLIIEPLPGLITPIYLWFNVKPSLPRNKKGITETYITGINLSHQTRDNWVNNLDIGYTGNHVQEIPFLRDTIPLQRQYVANNIDVTTLRYSNVLNLRSGVDGPEAVISSGAEYKKYSSSLAITRATAANTLFEKDPDNKNYAFFVQANPSYKNVYLTLGMRYEKNELFDASWNPRLGITTNFEIKSLIFKPRISWGKGITAPSYENRFGHPPNVSTVIYANPDILPQSQQGFDYGLEIYDKKGDFRFEAVYYDNVLQDMFAEQVLGQDTTDPNISAFKYLNIGKVSNRGWEFAGEYRINRLSLRGTFSIMNSTVIDTTGTYLLPQLEAAVGNRMYNLPRHTAGLNLTYYFLKLFGKTDKGSVSLNVTEVDGVRNIDRTTYTIDVSYGRIAYNPDFFGYPFQNSGVFRFGLYVDYHIQQDLRFFIQGNNIFNSYKYEYSTSYPTHGASWLFGLKYNFTKEDK